MLFRKCKAEAEPDTVDPVRRLFAAVDELNEAWKAMPKSLSIWIDWSERRVYVQCRAVTSTEVDEEAVRAMIGKR